MIYSFFPTVPSENRKVCWLLQIQNGNCVKGKSADISHCRKSTEEEDPNGCMQKTVDRKGEKKLDQIRKRNFFNPLQRSQNRLFLLFPDVSSLFVCFFPSLKTNQNFFPLCKSSIEVKVWRWPQRHYHLWLLQRKKQQEKKKKKKMHLVLEQPPFGEEALKM